MDDAMEANIKALPDDELLTEIVFADAFGPTIHPDAARWIELLHAEQAERGLT